MIRNIDFPEIKDVTVAIVPEPNTENPEKPNWCAYIINTGKTEIKNLKSSFKQKFKHIIIEILKRKNLTVEF